MLVPGRVQPSSFMLFDPSLPFYVYVVLSIPRRKFQPQKLRVSRPSILEFKLCSLDRIGSLTGNKAYGLPFVSLSLSGGKKVLMVGNAGETR